MSYLQDILSDAESQLTEAEKDVLRAAIEARDSANLYQSMRECGDGEEPWLAADAMAGDLESKAIEIIRRLRGK